MTPYIGISDGIDPEMRLQIHWCVESQRYEVTESCCEHVGDVPLPIPMPTPMTACAKCWVIMDHFLMVQL